MPSETIIDNRLTIHLDLSPSLLVNTRFLSDPKNRAHLANQLLIYDRIVIPTKDFCIVPILILWFGQDHFRTAVESEAISFLHKPHMIGYAGNGAGIVSFSISPSENRAFEWWQEAIFADMEKAVELQIKYMCPFIPGRERTRLLKSVLGHSRVIEYPKNMFEKYIMHETYTDILNDEELKALVILMSGNPSRIDLEKLPVVGPSEMKVSNYEPVKDSADIVLRVAEVNNSLIMASQIGDCDLFLPEGSDNLLKSKLARFGIGNTILNNFISLLDLNNLPDPGAAITKDAVTITDIWKLREKKESQKFRSWLRGANAEDARELEKIYVASLGKKSFVDSLPVRMIRFAITTAFGIIHPGIGIGLDVVDSFFVEKWLQGYSPKLFLDQLLNLYGVRFLRDERE